MLLRLLHPKVLRELETDARAQARFHLTLAWFWIISMVAVWFAWPPHDTASLIQLLILEVSLWANFATHFGALSAAQASSKQDSRPDIPLASDIYHL